MKSVWLLGDGDYSDYHIIGVFSSEKNAELMQEITGGSIREVILDPGVKETNAGMKMWVVSMLKNGDTENVEPVDRDIFDQLEEEAYLNSIWRWRRIVQRSLVVKTYAKDEKHAVKIANEKRIQMIANGEWESDD